MDNLLKDHRCPTHSRGSNEWVPGVTAFGPNLAGLGGPGLALFETWDFIIDHLHSVLSITARRWRWSNFRTYAYQEAGPIRLNDWSAHKLKFREVTTFPR